MSFFLLINTFLHVCVTIIEKLIIDEFKSSNTNVIFGQIWNQLLKSKIINTYVIK